MVALPFGLATIVVLTRVMGPEAYAPIAVALAVWSWATLTMNAVFGSTGVLLVAGAGDRWQAAASTLMALQVRLGLSCCVMLLLLAPLLSTWLRLPGVGVLLAILALDLPGFALASAQVSVLLARGALHARALVIVVFWLTRATLMIGAAVSGMGAVGVALAAPATSLAQLLILRRFVHTSLRVDMQMPPRALAAQSLLFFAFSSVVALIDRLGLLVLRPSGVDPVAIGWYAAAQTAATAPGLLTMLVSGLLLAMISRERARGRDAAAATAARSGLAWLVWLIPVLAVCAAAAPLIVRLAFGRAFEPAAPLLAWLCAAAWGMASLKISSAILAAHGHMKPIVAVAATTLAGCAVGYALFVPDGGALASAQVTAAVTCGGGAAAIALCARIGLRPGLRDTNARALSQLFSDTA